MTIWADADSLPREVRELITRRAGGSTPPMRAVFVANRKIPLPPGGNVTAVIVGSAGASPAPAAMAAAREAEDSLEPHDADSYILGRAALGDILVTRDIPLAARALGAGVIALNDRGELWTLDTVRERLSLRDHAAALRDAGLAVPLPKGRTFGPRDRNAFANALDRAITQAAKLQESSGMTRQS